MHRASTRFIRRDQHAPRFAPEDGERRDDPGAMHCEHCSTTWYSRMVDLVVAAGMTCARCGGPLRAGRARSASVRAAGP